MNIGTDCDPCEQALDEALAELDDVVKERDAALTMLRRIEWAAELGEAVCPICLQNSPGENRFDHLSDCKLVELLKGGDES